MPQTPTAHPPYHHHSPPPGTHASLSKRKATFLAQQHFMTDFYDIIFPNIFLQGTQNFPTQTHSGLTIISQNSVEYSTFCCLLDSYSSCLFSKMDLQINMMTSPLYRWK